ncbi:MAG: hypothetical protein H0V26_09085 [Solirubrobacterales bacterium]|nr:hypothetical protein [Solirubrobacterales bacterium]
MPTTGLAAIPRPLLYSNVTFGAKIAYCSLADWDACAAGGPAEFQININGLAYGICRKPSTVIGYLKELSPKYIRHEFAQCKDSAEWADFFYFIPVPISVPDTVPDAWKATE